ncbi:glycoside hydrolase family 43 protein [Paraprevotella clara]|uniref:glycoside hydrolase family 43 protein n=1 Tax=Paraprevotella clara TaxID=454154 RepID=UPI0026773C2E|nr:glycoside hydrolase family 43 protein [Paraprevotella clara]
MKMKKTLLTKALWALLSCMPTLQAQADYPLFWQRYTADPWGIEHGGRLYLFCSHDTYDPARGYGYFMNDITCISTDDLKNWTDHGEVFRAADSKWGARNTWAPCVVERDGKFYLYYGDANAGGIGVAVSDSPTGPFVDNLERPLVGLDTPGVILRDENGQLVKSAPDVEGALSGSENWGMWCFDPTAFVDDDGQAYLCFGGAHPDNSRIIKLKDNMTEIDGTAVKPHTPGFFEASAIHKYNGKYYYSYSGHYYNMPCNIEYVTSDKPMEGYEGKPGIVMRNPPVNDGYNHHQCIFSYRGEWYLAYHNRQVAYERNETDTRAREYMRSVCLDRLYYNEDGTIRPVEATRDGLPQLKYVDPYVENEAETMAKGWNIEVSDVAERGGNRAVAPLEDDAYVKVRGVDFSRGCSSFTARVACSNAGGGTIEIRLENPDGLLAGTLKVPSTGSTAQWQTCETSVSMYPGLYDIYFVFRGNRKASMLMDRWTFK